MADQPKYLDVNQEFWRDCFKQALEYDAYLATADERHQQRWRDAELRTTLTAEEAHRLGSITRVINLLVMSGAWCGDCVRQGPIFLRIAEAAPMIRLRWIDRETSPKLRDMLRINGAMKVPVAVYLSEDFYEVGRFGDRPLSIYRAKAQRELGAACETGIVPPSEEALRTEISEWVDITEWMYLILRTAPMLRERHGD